MNVKNKVKVKSVASSIIVNSLENVNGKLVELGLENSLTAERQGI
jgi:hypothetical protein